MKLRRSVFQAAAALCVLAAGSPLVLQADDPPNSAVAAKSDVKSLNLSDVSIPVDITGVARAKGQDGAEFTLGHTLESGWHTRVSSGNPRSPDAGEGVVAVGCGGGKDVYGFDLHTGQRVWTCTSKDSGISSIVVEGDSAYFTTHSCTLERIRLVDGKHEFKKWLAPTVNCAPDVEGDFVAAAYRKSGKHNVSLHSSGKGGKKWITSLGSTVLTAPIIHGNSVLASRADGSLTSLATEKGDELWTSKVGAVSAPVATKWGLFVTTSWDSKKPLPNIANENSDRKTGSRATSSSRELPMKTLAGVKDRRVCRIDNTEVKAKDEDAPAIVGPRRTGLDFQGLRPGFSASSLFFAYDGKVAAVDPLIGDVDWEVTLGSSKISFQQPIASEGLVLLATNAGHVIALEEETGALVWAYQFAGKNFAAAPCIEGGRVFLTTKTGDLISVPLGLDVVTMENSDDTDTADDTEGKANMWRRVQQTFRKIRDIVRDPDAPEKLPAKGDKPADANEDLPDDNAGNSANVSGDAVRRDDDEEAEGLSKGEFERREARKAERDSPNGRDYKEKKYRRD